MCSGFAMKRPFIIIEAGEALRIAGALSGGKAPAGISRDGENGPRPLCETARGRGDDPPLGIAVLPVHKL